MAIDLFVVGLTSAGNLLLGLLVFLQNPKGAVNRLFALFSCSVIFWTITNYFADFAPQGNLIFTRLAFVSAPLIAYSILLISIVFPISHARKRKKLITGESLLTLIMMIGSATPFLISGVEKTSQGVDLKAGVLYGVYIVLLLQFIPFVIKIFSVSYKLGGQRDRTQIRFFLTGILIYAALAIASNLLIPFFSDSWSVTKLGPIFSLIFVGFVAYAIVKHGLFDIKLAAVRSVAYILSIASLAIIYYFLAYIISTTLFQGDVTSTVSISPVNVILALGLAFVFQPIKNFFDRTTDKIFYRDRYHSDEFYARLSEVLTTTTDLRGLLERAAGEIGTTLKAEQAFFFVQYNHVHHVTAGTAHHTGLPIHDVHYLNDYILKNGDGVLVTQLLGEGTTLRRLLVSHKISLLMPLVRGPLVLGYLALGDQLSSGYTNRDIKVLKTISDELIIAIQNALSVQEVKDINSNLEQRIDAATKELRSSNARLRRLDATKDEFLSMASHQLRTPLTSIKGYLSMVLEGDVGHISQQQRHLLEEAFSGSERMVHLIHDFLNVSRLQTGKFVLETHAYDLVKLTRQEVDSLERVATSRHLKLKMITTLHELPLVIDEDKIRQVVMNFIDNAIYYSHENTTITIELLKKTDGNVELRVNDTGIGVPASEQAQLFEKFYRASNARKQRPDGTGVGLYLAKKVISAHGGEVFFETKEGRGSTFGFRLPLDKLKVTPTPVSEPAQLAAK